MDVDVDVDFIKVVRKPFLVEAVEVTDDNIAEIAPLIGTLRERDGNRYIQVNAWLVPNVPRVYTGFWVTRLDDTIRCYSRRAFLAQFMEVNDEILSWVNSVNKSNHRKKAFTNNNERSNG